jgi:uncharacterized membrane protein
MSRTSSASPAMTAAVAAVASLIAHSASAQVHPEKPTYKYEKCYGIVKAGKNDCFTPANSCAGTVTRDNVSAAWIYVPQGTCEKIVGGSVEAPKRST